MEGTYLGAIFTVQLKHMTRTTIQRVIKAIKKEAREAGVKTLPKSLVVAKLWENGFTIAEINKAL